MEDGIDRLGEAAVFSTLDANCGYWKIPVVAEDRDKTCFTTNIGTHRYETIPFGLHNAPANLQRVLDIILSGIRWKICLVYLDEVIVSSSTVDPPRRTFGKGVVASEISRCDAQGEKVCVLSQKGDLSRSHNYSWKTRLRYRPDDFRTGRNLPHGEEEVAIVLRCL